MQPGITACPVSAWTALQQLSHPPRLHAAEKGGSSESAHRELDSRVSLAGSRGAAMEVTQPLWPSSSPRRVRVLQGTGERGRRSGQARAAAAATAKCWAGRLNRLLPPIASAGIRPTTRRGLGALGAGNWAELMAGRRHRWAGAVGPAATACWLGPQRARAPPDHAAQHVMHPLLLAASSADSLRHGAWRLGVREAERGPRRLFELAGLHGCANLHELLRSPCRPNPRCLMRENRREI